MEIAQIRYDIFIKTWLNAWLLFYFSTEEPETTKRCCPCKKHGPVGGYGYKPKYGYEPPKYDDGYGYKPPTYGGYQPQNDYYQPPQYGLVSNYGAPQYDYGLVSNYGTPQYGGDYSYGKHIYFIKKETNSIMTNAGSKFFINVIQI